MLDGRCRVFNVFVLHSTTLLLPREYRESIRCACEEDILDYLNSRMDLTTDEIITILEELDFKVYDDGTVEW